MGERRNVRLHYAGGDSVTVYTHNGGYELVKTVQAALRRGRSRWSDQSYLARIIFSEVIRDNVLSDTGYGLYPGSTEVLTDHPSINVHLDTNRVTIGTLGWAFTDFIKSDEELSRE